MLYNKDILNFWESVGLHFIKPEIGEEFPEGWDVRDLLVKIICDDSIVEIGCGYGRLAGKFKPSQYIGFDINDNVIIKANEENPEYTFNKCTVGYTPKDSKWVLFYTVLLHVSDDDIEEFVKKSTLNTNKVIVGEILGRKWRREGNPPVFNREEKEYDELFTNMGFKKTKRISKPYTRYSNTEVVFLIYEKKKENKPNSDNTNVIINPEEYDNTCYIVGGGTSLKDFDWTLIDDDNKFVIAINNSYTKLPNAQILYCTDPPWIQVHIKDLENFKGLIYQGVLNLNKPTKLPIVDKQWHLTSKDGLETKKDSLKHGSNSTYAAINMAAVHLGFKKIYLLGIDMRWGQYGKKETSHWHSDTMPHKRIDSEIVYRKMKDGYKTIKQPLLDMNVEVFNINSPENTTLDTFPLISTEEHFKI